MEQSLSEVQHTLSAKINELHEAHQQNEKLARTIGQYSRDETTTFMVLQKDKKQNRRLHVADFCFVFQRR